MHGFPWKIFFFAAWNDGKFCWDFFSVFFWGSCTKKGASPLGESTCQFLADGNWVKIQQPLDKYTDTPIISYHHRWRVTHLLPPETCATERCSWICILGFPKTSDDCLVNGRIHCQGVIS